MSSRIQKRFVFVIIILLLSIFLSSCDLGIAEDAITVYSGDRYSREIMVSIDATTLEFLGGASMIEDSLDDYVIEGAAHGEKISWKRLESVEEDLVTFQINVAKADISDAEWVGFTWKETTYNGKKAYRFEYPEFITASIEFASLTFTLHAGKILDSNGIEIDGKSVRWNNPSVIPYAIVRPKGLTSSLPVIGVLAVLGILLGVVLVLWLTGKLIPMVNMVVSSVQWRNQMAQFNTSLEKVINEKAKLKSNLGLMAWEKRISNANYRELYTELKDLDQKINQINAQKQSNEEEISNLQQVRIDVITKFAPKIDTLSEQQTTAASNLQKSHRAVTDLQSRLSIAESEQTKAKNEILSMRESLSTAEYSTDPDKDAKVRAFSNAIKTLEGQLVDSESGSTALQREIEQREKEVIPLKDTLGEITEELSGVQADKKKELDALDEQIQSLTRKNIEHGRDLKEKSTMMDPLIEKLGPLVDQARPESPVFTGIYAKLDELYIKETEDSQQRDLLMARLETTNKKDIRLIYILAIGIVISIITLIVLLN